MAIKRIRDESQEDVLPAIRRSDLVAELWRELRARAKVYLREVTIVRAESGRPAARVSCRSLS
jgi:hypothetical protein